MNWTTTFYVAAGIFGYLYLLKSTERKLHPCSVMVEVKSLDKDPKRVLPEHFEVFHKRCKLIDTPNTGMHFGLENDIFAKIVKVTISEERYPEVVCVIETTSLNYFEEVVGQLKEFGWNHRKY